MDMNKYIEKKYMDLATVGGLQNKGFVILSYLKDKSGTFGVQPVFMVELLENHAQKEWTMGWNDIPKWIAKHGPESTKYSGKEGVFGVGKSRKNVDILVGEPV